MFIPIAKLLNYAMLNTIHRVILQITIFLALAILLGCHSSRPSYINPGNTDSLAGLQALANTKAARIRNRQRIGKMRGMAIREEALSLGAQAGLAWRANEIDKDLARQARLLESVYNFNALILDQNILPPVLLEGRNTLNLADTQNIRIADHVYKLAKQARFVTTPPNWRQYIWLDYQKPDLPDQTMLPRTRQEKRLWCTYVARGWKNGIEQANNILEESIARLKEDFTGMVLYRKLLAMNMVSPPFVSHTNLGITGDESEMRIDDRVLRITALPALNINSSEWRAAVAKEENVLAKFKKMENLANHTEITITSKAWQPMITPVN